MLNEGNYKRFRNLVDILISQPRFQDSFNTIRMIYFVPRKMTWSYAMPIGTVNFKTMSGVLFLMDFHSILTILNLLGVGDIRLSPGSIKEN